jgi:uncharacterized membrane protein
MDSRATIVPHSTRGVSNRGQVIPDDTLSAHLTTNAEELTVTRGQRVESVDLLRGLVMVVMALDHVRDFFGGTGVSPTNMATTTVALFFTRWITHVCAPVFFLLTGTGAYLAMRRRSPGDLARFLWTRGVWLIFLDVVVVRCVALQFNVDYRVTVLNVLWALGWSMIVLSSLVRLRPSSVATFGVVMIAVHNLLDPIRPPMLGWFAPVWSILHVQGVVVNMPGHVVLAAYPLIPWVAVTALGFGLAPVFDWPIERRRRLLLRVGIAVTAAFAVVRIVNVYGDPVPWAVQRSAVMTGLSFLNATKYPPSLVFLLMTLGPAFILLRAFDRPVSGSLRPVLTIGRVPLFYFVAHLAAIHGLAVLICWLRYGAVHWMFESPDLSRFPITEPPGWPLGLPAVYVIWISLVVALYPLCRWYAAVKARSRSRWLSYL